MNKIILPQADLYFIEESIIKVEMKDHEEMDLEQMKIFIAAIRKLADLKPYGCLVDMRNSNGSISNEARQYAADNSYPPNKLADALIYNSLAKKLIANFYIQFNKPKSPTRTFTSEQSALKWLRNIRQNAENKANK
jgi:hypothetical protein